MECAFGHPREDVNHRINPIFLISICETHHFDSIGEECTVEKPIQQEHLTWYEKKDILFKEILVLNSDSAMLAIGCRSS